jgi:hypothetical protein
MWPILIFIITFAFSTFALVLNFRIFASPVALVLILAQYSFLKHMNFCSHFDFCKSKCSNKNKNPKLTSEGSKCRFPCFCGAALGSLAFDLRLKIPSKGSEGITGKS